MLAQACTGKCPCDTQASPSNNRMDGESSHTRTVLVPCHVNTLADDLEGFTMDFSIPTNTAGFTIGGKWECVASRQFCVAPVPFFHYSLPPVAFCSLVARSSEICDFVFTTSPSGVHLFGSPGTARCSWRSSTQIHVVGPPLNGSCSPCFAY